MNSVIYSSSVKSSQKTAVIFVQAALESDHQQEIKHSACKFVNQVKTIFITSKQGGLH